MKKDTIQIRYGSERIRAMNVQLAKKNSTLEVELSGMIDTLYVKTVKPEVREFIELLERSSKKNE